MKFTSNVEKLKGGRLIKLLGGHIASIAAVFCSFMMKLATLLLPRWHRLVFWILKSSWKLSADVLLNLFFLTYNTENPAGFHLKSEMSTVLLSLKVDLKMPHC